jgi:hypothetical protein
MSSSANRALAPKHEKLKSQRIAQKPYLRANQIAFKKQVQLDRPMLSIERQEQRNRFRKHF